MAGMPNSTNALIAPETNASKIASKNRCAMRRRRPAPSAARIDSSFSRLAPRTSIMPEMFRHTIRSTVPARLSKTLVTRRDSGRPAAPIEVYGSTVAALNSFDAGYCCARPATVADTSAFACVMLHTWFEPAVDLQPVDVPVVSKIRIRLQARVSLQGNEHHRARRLKEVEVPAKVGRRDPDHRMRQRHRASPTSRRCPDRPPTGSARSRRSIRRAARPMSRRQSPDRIPVRARATRQTSGSSWPTRTASSHPAAPASSELSAPAWSEFPDPRREGHAGIGSRAAPDSPDRTTSRAPTRRLWRGADRAGAPGARSARRC